LRIEGILAIDTLNWRNTLSITAILLTGNLIFEKNIGGECKNYITLNLDFIK